MKSYISFLLLILLYNISFSQQISTEQVISDEVISHIKERVDSGLNPSIAVGFIDGDEVTFYSYGKSSLDDGFSVDENTVYEIGSISKTFTTTLLANEIVKGELNLNDPISNYVPENVKVPSRKNRQITFLDLATHSSGLPRMPSNFNPADPANPYLDYTPELMYEFISNHELIRDVGEQLEYSNYGMGFLGHILELINKTDYESLVVEVIAEPLGMKNTRLNLTNDMKSKLALGHDGGRQVSNWDLTGLAGAGGIRSTTSDMVKYLMANMKPEESSMEQSLRMTHKKYYEDKSQGATIGLGWFFENEGKILWHNGGTGGYRAFAGFNVDGSKGVVVFTNSTVSIDAIGFKLLGGPTELVMPKKPISGLLYLEIENNGIKSAIERYKELKTQNTDEYNFSESELNELGYTMMGMDKDEAALALFKLNVEEHPKSSNVYDSLGEVQLKLGDTINSIQNYKRAVSMNPGNSGAIKILRDLGHDVSDLIKEVNVSDDVLNSYVGEYRLSPNFSIVITTEENKIFVQATNQPRFEIFPSSENEFYLKVVEARVVFEKNENGEISHLVLFQNGQEMPGKKIK